LTHEIEVLAVIPARGGSKGIPHKNVKLLGGKPLIAHTIEQVQLARSIRRLVVSTDDPIIARVSKECGAEVVERPAEISGDTAPSEAALLHALAYLEHVENYIPDLVVFLQCTSPLTTAEDIDGTVAVLLDEHADSALAVTPFHYFLWRYDSQGQAVGINHDKSVRPLRQEREPQFRETGAVYALRSEGFRKARHRFFGKTALYVTPPERCLEIDEPEDLLVAEVLLRGRCPGETNLQVLPNPIGALVFDFDGVFTDNRVFVLQDGREAVVCDRSDGWGLAQLKKLDLPLLVLSTEENPVVRSRCAKLNVPYCQGVRDKLPVLLVWLAERGVDPSQVVYVANDVNDVPCMQAVGCPIAVNDAYPEARAAARIILSAPGGRGAVREVADLVMQRVKEHVNAPQH
jgi:YrbI family 3-deoxy-D-manno-octulosonate 8-phosphate phosphatase